MTSFLNHKINALIVFLGSFGFGSFFLENYKLIGNFAGAIVSTIIIELIKNHYKNKKK